MEAGRNYKIFQVALACKPCARSYRILVCWWDEGYGQTQWNKSHIVSEVWHFDPELDRYSAGPLLPGRRAGGGLVRLGDNLHYISGLMEDRDTDSGDHWVFNLKDWDKDQSAQWEKLAPLPNPRNQLSVTVLNDKIYIIGGQYNHDLQQLDQPLVHIYDASKDT